MQCSTKGRTELRCASAEALGILVAVLLVTGTVFGGPLSDPVATPQGQPAEGVSGDQLGQGDAEAGLEDRSIRVTIPVGSYEIADTARGHEILVEDFGSLLVPGKPRIPSRIFAVALPPGAEVVDVRFEAGEGIALPGVYSIPPVPVPRAIGVEDPAVHAAETARYAQNFNSVYGSDAAYPGSVGEFVRTAGYRGYHLVDVRITPFAYRPLSGRLVHYPDIIVHVDYRFPKEPRDPVVDHLPRTERTAKEIIINYERAASWRASGRSTERGLHDFVIITLDSLTSSVAPLAAWETAKGRTVEIVTTSWIDSNYTGYDLAEKMRNFLRDTYPSDEWGIEDVLFVGHYDDVPMRLTWQDTGYGKPETDYYYAELSLPDAESWDADGDHQWGEGSDPIDFYAEVNVGRIPWSDPATVESICEKSVAYEESNDPAFKNNILLLGAFFWPDTDNAVLMEAKVDQLWMADWTMTRMYEQGQSGYAMDYDLSYNNVMLVWSAGSYAFVNWAGHGSPTACYEYYPSQPFVDTGTCSYLNDDYPAIIFADACSNSDTDHLNIGQAMLEQGGVGFLGATKVAYGMPAWSGPMDGSSQSLDYFFTTSVTSMEYTQGSAHQWSLREMYVNGLWYYDKYETFEWGALWGNPDLGMAPALALSILFPAGLPETLTPGAPTPIDVELVTVGQTVVPDSPTLYYRYGGGAYVTAPLEPLGGDLYRATLPPTTCGVTAEYYFSAEGSATGIEYEPSDAPANRFFAGVGEIVTILEDEFETDQGWTVEDVDVETGSWERGVPAGDGARGDPLTDFDGSGQCYLTGNALGNSDVDGGPTRLISPLLDLGAGNDPVLSYARWFRCDDDLPPAQDFLDVEVSNDDGASWTLIETVADTEGWVQQTMRIADYVALTAQVRVRFSVMDNPNNSKTEAGIDAVEVSDLVCVVAGNGDFDDDGDVDLDDFARFPDCLAGPGATPDPPDPFSVEDCLTAFDFDGDLDVDLEDFGGFQQGFGG